jgi:hypothetical protein
VSIYIRCRWFDGCFPGYGKRERRTEVPNRSLRGRTPRPVVISIWRLVPWSS